MIPPVIPGVRFEDVLPGSQRSRGNETEATAFAGSSCSPTSTSRPGSDCSPVIASGFRLFSYVIVSGFRLFSYVIVSGFRLWGKLSGKCSVGFGSSLAFASAFASPFASAFASAFASPFASAFASPFASAFASPFAAAFAFALSSHSSSNFLCCA